MDLAALRDELLNDPDGVGYAEALARGDDVAVAELLNTVREGLKVPRGVVSKAEILANIDAKELQDITQTKRDALDFVLKQAEAIDLSAEGAQAHFKEAFGTNAKTIAALTERDGSRAEAVLGVGIGLIPEAVGQALAQDRAASYEAAQAALQTEAVKQLENVSDTDDEGNKRTEVQRMREALERADQELNGAEWGHK